MAGNTSDVERRLRALENKLTRLERDNQKLRDQIDREKQRSILKRGAFAAN